MGSVCVPSFAFAILGIEPLQLFFLTGWAVLFFDCFLKAQEGEERVSNHPKMVEIVLHLNKPLARAAWNSESGSALYNRTLSDFGSFSFVFLFRGLFLKEDCVAGPLPFQGK